MSEGRASGDHLLEDGVVAKGFPVVIKGGFFDLFEEAALALDAV